MACAPADTCLAPTLIMVQVTNVKWAPVCHQSLPRVAPDASSNSSSGRREQQRWSHKTAQLASADASGAVFLWDVAMCQVSKHNTLHHTPAPFRYTHPHLTAMCHTLLSHTHTHRLSASWTQHRLSCEIVCMALVPTPLTLAVAVAACCLQGIQAKRSGRLSRAARSLRRGDIGNSSSESLVVDGDGVSTLAWSPTAAFLATVGSDRRIIVWNVSTGAQLWQRQFASTLFALLFDPFDSSRSCLLTADG